MHRRGAGRQPPHPSFSFSCPCSNSLSLSLSTSFHLFFLGSFHPIHALRLAHQSFFFICPLAHSPSRNRPFHQVFLTVASLREARIFYFRSLSLSLSHLLILLFRPRTYLELSQYSPLLPTHSTNLLYGGIIKCPGLHIQNQWLHVLLHPDDHEGRRTPRGQVSKTGGWMLNGGGVTTPTLMFRPALCLHIYMRM